MSKLTRYPGPQPFTESQSNIFYGREVSAQALHRLIGQENLVVLHAKSGVGKSSLLKAGLLPLLRENSGFIPLEIRLGSAGSAGVIQPDETVRIKVQQATENSAAGFLQQILPIDNSIWRSLKEWQLSQLATLGEEEELPTLLLIFDQFEELFSYPPDAQLAFRRQLAEVLHTCLPRRYWDMLSLYGEEDAPFTDQEKRHLLNGLKVHVVTAIREDRMHLLGSLADYLPTISKNWFELKHLSREEAALAIEEPAAHTGDFATPPFTFDPAAQQAIISYLSSREGGIESTQLQVICDALDRRMAEQSHRVLTPALTGDLEAITAQFYQDKLLEIDDVDQRRLVRLLVEKKLIYAQAKRRLSLFSGQIYDLGISPKTLGILVDGHLLRAEPDMKGGYNYEISHDSLVEPILKARWEREAEEEESKRLEEAAAAEQERQRVAAEQARELAAEREKGRKVRRLNRVLLAALAVAVLAVGAAVHFGLVARESEQAAITAKEEARKQADLAEAVLDKIYFYAGEFGMATTGSGGSINFGFINKQLETKINFEYDEAQPFDNAGFAKVKKYGGYYLIDTTGRAYPLATEIDGVKYNPKILALDLSGKNREELPDLASIYPNLEVLYLDYLGLINVDGLVNLTALTYLDISNNSLTKIDGLANLTALTYLDISRNNLTKVDGLESLTALTYLDISNNSLTKVDGLESLTALTYLDISLNFTLTKIDALANLTTLTRLDISRNSVTKVDGLESLTALTYLNLKANSLTKVDGLESLTALTYLDISRNNLTKVDGLESLTALTYLNLSANSLTKVDGLESLTALTYLNLSANSLTKVDGLESLTALTYLDLSVNFTLTKIDALANLTALTRLDLGFTRLYNIDVLANLTALNRLNLYHNHLTNLDGLKNLTALTDLNLSFNGNLTNVDGLTNLTALTDLNLTFNGNLTNVDGLTNLTALTHLNIIENENLTNVDGLKNLTTLTTLDLSSNKNLTNVDGLKNLTALTNLNLNYNTSLTNVDGLKNLTALTRLDLEDNYNLTNVDALFNLKNLKELALSGTAIPKEKVAELKVALPNCDISFQ